MNSNHHHPSETTFVRSELEDVTILFGSVKISRVGSAKPRESRFVRCIALGDSDAEGNFLVSKVSDEDEDVTLRLDVGGGGTTHAVNKDINVRVQLADQCEALPTETQATGGRNRAVLVMFLALETEVNDSTPARLHSSEV